MKNKGWARLAAAAVLAALAVCFCTSCTSIESDIDAGGTSYSDDHEHTAPDDDHTSGIGARPAVFTVIIDPGHGFGDPGSHPEFLYSDEAVITLKAAKSLQSALNARGIKTVLTHDGEKFPSVREICAAADKYNIDYDAGKMNDNDVFNAYERVIYSNVLTKEISNCFFVSLHTNSVENSPSTCGLSIDYYDESPYRSALSNFSEAFQIKVGSELGKKTKVFADNTKEAYIVNKYCLSPSVLIEMGYGSNASDGSDLMNEAWIDRFAAVLAELIDENKNIF